MAEYTYPIDTEHNIYSNITVCKRLADGVLVGWRINPNEGYVFYDTNAEYWEIDPETEEEILVTKYFTLAHLPLTYDWDNFSYVAVLRSEITSESEVL